MGMYGLLDLTNHAPLPRKYRYEPAHTIRAQLVNPAFLMYADRDFLAGQAIVWDYGFLSNTELFFIHGFVIDHNLDEPILVRADRAQSSMAECMELESDSGAECLFTVYPYIVSKSYLWYLRLAAAGAADLP
jgi:hypothetical protein